MKKLISALLYIFFISGNNKSLLISLLLIFQINALSVAQTPYFRNFRENDGLASATVYFICQDSGGFIWFATDAGVSRYNGYSFENYTTKNGLGDNEIFKIFEDSQKRVWFLSFNGKISYWHKGKFYNSSNTSFLKTIDSDSYFSHIIEDKKKNIWITTERSGIIKLNPENEVKRYNSFPVVAYIYESTDEKILAITHSGVLDLSTNHIIYNNPLLCPSTIILIRSKYIGNDNLLFTNQDELYVFNHRKLSCEKLPDKVLFQKVMNICKGNDNEKWICTRDGIHKLFDGGSENYLPGEQVTFVLEDLEGNTWFSTLGNGVYFTPALGILNYTKKDGLPVNECYTLKAASNNDLWIGQEKAWLTRISKNKISSYLLRKGIGADRGRITSICETGHSLWMTSDFEIVKFENNKPHIWHATLGQKSIIKKGDSLIFGGYQGIIIKKQASIDSVIRKNNYLFTLPLSVSSKIFNEFLGKPYMTGRTNKLFKDSKDRVWIGMNNGLRILNNDSIMDFHKIYPQLTCRISGITEAPDQTIWISTYENGIFSYRDQKLRHITEKDGLLSDICNNIEVDKENIVWVATNNGINKVGYSEGTLKIEYFNFNNGLISNQINSICVKGEKVWAATPMGLGCFNKSLINKKTPPFIHITNFYLLGENKKYNKKEDYSLKYYENSIKIDYVGISYRHFNSPLLYRYKFDKKDTTWYYTTNTSIEFPLLNPGDYEFVVESRSNEGIWSTKSSSISFSIQAPFWQTFWFYFILACLFIIGVWLIFSLRFKSLEKKETLLRTVTESKLKALRAQMDPHFIFNSLMALQNLVRKSADDAEIYISKFAKLMRLILDNSRSEYIPLSDEIETLQNYFELQQLRRINLFEYNIYVDPAIDRDDISIPPMLAQPFIENSIEHGIFNKTEKGMINLRFTLIDNLIELEVEDNGIGFQKSIEMKEKFKKIHKSLATTIIKERLVLLNRKKEEKISLNIADVKDGSGSVIGTKVTIRVPFLSRYSSEE